MRIFSSRPIRVKLMMIVMIANCAALLLACLAFVVNDMFSYREIMLKDLSTRAQIIGNNSTAALSFGDSKPVEEIMAALSADPHLVAAGVFSSDNQLFAQYRRRDVKAPLPLRAEPQKAWFTSEYLHLFSDITFNGRNIGSVYLQSDLQGLRGRVKGNATITLLVMVAAIGIAFLLSVRLQRVVSNPITDLATMATEIAREKNFSVRAVKQSDDELGHLVEGFNEMLTQIQRRDLALRKAHEELEHRVEERTRELSQANERLNLEIESRKRSQQELEAMQQRLMEASRQAGMAEVATGVLHNVGNVLNSVNVSATVVQERLGKSKLTSLYKTADLLRARASDLSDFLSKDPKGKLIPDFIIKLAAHIGDEQKGILQEMSVLARNIEHIKEIVAMQQSYAKVSGVTESLPAQQLVEDALRINETSLVKDGVQVVREFAPVPAVTIDKHKALQILVNLIRNARQALAAGRSQARTLTVKVGMTGSDSVQIIVKDNGMGIAPENLSRIFGHGFTTKKDGHGFGLHSGALAAKEMGGSIKAHSDGLGTGAEFTLELPINRSIKAAA
jgi:C4-dicarboxylate-specific signal transduction histidine kinase